MLRSMYSGISGMKNFQTKLDVIGNNIANVNTYGFKKSRVTFKDMVYQQTVGASTATNNRAGTNPQQVGLGSTIGSIDTIHTTGSTQTTSRSLDLALTGDGFFVVGTINDLTRVNIDRGNVYGDNKILGNIDRAIDLNYTRAGNFYLNDQGYLVTSDGYYVIGDTGEKSIPTDEHFIKSNKALDAITNFETPFKNMQDNLRELDVKAQDLLSAYLDYEEAFTIWDKNTPQDERNDTTTRDYKAMNDAYVALGTVLGEFDDFVKRNTGYNTAVDGYTSGLTDPNSINTAITEFNTEEPISAILKQISTIIAPLAEGTDYPDLTLPAIENSVQDDIKIMNSLVSTIDSYKLDIEKVGQAIVEFEDAALDLQDPKWTENLSGEAGLIQIPLNAKSFSIGPDGKVTFISDTGELQLAGQLRLANFANAGGLEKAGGNLFRESVNSGVIDQDNNGVQLDELFAPGTEGVASIVAGTLEMSNVDLAEEFTDMIVAQRGFQSNTKIITTSDEILQELVNLKR